MKTQIKILIVAALGAAVVAAVALKKNKDHTKNDAASPPTAVQSAAANEATNTPGAPAPASGNATTTVAPAATAKLPKLLDLGADKCIPCKMMAPLLEELRREYAGRLEVEFIDVRKNPDAGRQYGIQMIPTQIFYDAEGRERARHVGFIGKEDILAKFHELGVELGGKTASAKPTQ